MPGIGLGERLEDAAERETYEETGFLVKVTKLAGLIDKIMYDSNGKIEYHYVLINFFVEQIEGDKDQKPIPDSDALDAKFVPFEELKDFTLTDSLIELLKQLKIGYD
jgi:ADP-ribose pyrophosphatase YjhB (NUDIX family)